MEFCSCWDRFQIVLCYDDLDMSQIFAEDGVQTPVDGQSSKREKKTPQLSFQYKMLAES